MDRSRTEPATQPCPLHTPREHGTSAVCIAGYASRPHLRLTADTMPQLPEIPAAVATDPIVAAAYAGAAGAGSAAGAGGAAAGSASASDSAAAVACAVAGLAAQCSSGCCCGRSCCYTSGCW
eukprot:TRINITY_DN19039_c0_g3_i1.p1 TRINITY_DN19039_c0_g3~~TRINITY_DN19039_c0_g3_i1.p1  ORF type:complete len:122 (-),score=17.96 TRINITY_DN19039_c0_g3_i1:54-419(-)